MALRRPSDPLFARDDLLPFGTRRSSGTLGLGLYISKAIVAAHGGSINIDSEEGKGSKVTIRLPVS